MMNQFKSDFSDAVILKLVVETDRAEIHLKDWQENEHVVLVEDVLMLEDHESVGEEISHMRMSQNDELVRVRWARAKKTPAAYHSFTFFGAWSEQPILTFVAGRLSVTDAESKC